MYDYPKMSNEKKKIRLFFVEIQDKTEKDYNKKYCHPAMHPRNYATTTQIWVECGKFDAFSESEREDFLVAEGRKKGLKGNFVIQRVMGGPGRRWRHLEILHGRGYQRGINGMPEICRITL